MPFFIRLLLAVSATCFLTQPLIAQQYIDRLLKTGVEYDLPVVKPNDNRVPAGEWKEEVMEFRLEVGWADWRVETRDRPGLRVAAFSEEGKAPEIPAPLIRVTEGTILRIRVFNTLEDSTITVFGLHQRPAEVPDSLVVEPGQARTVQFEAGEPGTYNYWARSGFVLDSSVGERGQMGGAFVVDPLEGSPEDRIFVINVFWEFADESVHDQRFLEGLTINGLSWPFTELQKLDVGKTVRWRIINSSHENHPMHLHGFYYDVHSRGSYLKDEIYTVENRRKVVTEFMTPNSTMVLEWTPERPGNWLFHCHLSFHVAANLRLPGAMLHGEPHEHMAGLVMGIEVSPGPTDLISKGEQRNITLYANEYSTDSLSTYGFSLNPDFAPDSIHPAAPGSLLLLNQYQTTNVKVANRMSISTGVHWHGLELDSWADGVPGWSKSDGMVSPVIGPGEEFVYKLSAMRPGTFIYHSHLDDIKQLTGGLYGPLLVLPEGANYDPLHDHIYMVQWKNSNPQSIDDMELNGRREQPLKHAVAGDSHRLRLINIAPAGNIFLQMQKDSIPVAVKAIAKDGADLPENQQVEIEISPRFGVGETADFLFTPTEPGVYELMIGYSPNRSWRQRWEVTAEAQPVEVN